MTFQLCFIGTRELIDYPPVEISSITFTNIFFCSAEPRDKELHDQT